VKRITAQEGMMALTLIPALIRLRQDDQELETGLGFITRSCLKKEFGKL
jgi:hypothetical protein